MPSSSFSGFGGGTQAATGHVHLQPHQLHPVCAGRRHVHQGPGSSEVRTGGGRLARWVFVIDFVMKGGQPEADQKLNI